MHPQLTIQDYKDSRQSKKPKQLSKKEKRAKKTKNGQEISYEISEKEIFIKGQLT